MKWAVLVMTVLGLMAAMCAAILVAFLSHPSAGRSSSTGPVTVLMINRNLPAMSVVQGSDVTSQTMSSDKAPANFMTNSVQVVGRVLAVPMVAGEAFSPAVFAGQGAGADLAAAIPYGDRAEGIDVTNYGALEGMLYPGCAVDVEVTLTPPQSGTQSSMPISATILQNVEVLAINNSTITSSEAGNSTDNNNADDSGTRRVILLVDSRQAKILRLAATVGTLSLAMRNPLDTSASNAETITLNELTADNYMDNLYNSATPSTPQNSQMSTTAPVNTEGAVWNVEVIRGSQSQEEVFPLTEVHP
ncbi:MAG TPA: Flp pilus assembly protein CpaB [Phycisphaerae bacterium]|nr:Flp pilus assembly protein CpaB [Phycisphaerae bacterium]